MLSIMSMGESLFFHQKVGTPDPSLREEICTTRTLQGTMFPAYPLSRKTAGTPEEKAQNLNHRGRRD
jgi:hypothetical protein